MEKTARILAVAACLLALAVGLPALAADFTADMTQTLNGAPLLTGKAFVKGGMVRVESTVQGVRQVVISDPDKGRMAMLQPDAKLFMEKRVDTAKAGGDVLRSDAGGKGSWRPVGREKFAGLDCEKRVLDFTDKSMGSLTAWFADGLDYPVKTVFVNGKDTMVVEYANVKPGPLDPSLFEVPPGYQRMNVPDQSPGGAKPGKKPGM